MDILDLKTNAPLRQHADGTIRVGATRVSLDSVAALFDQGATAEQVTESFPTLDLAEVYETFAFLLREPEATASYLEERNAGALRHPAPAPLGARLANRRPSTRRKRRGGASEAA